MKQTTMDTVERSQLRQILYNRQEAMANRWYEAVGRTSFVPLQATEVRRHFITWTEQAIELLLAEAFDARRAEALGAALAGLHVVQPEALGRTQEILVRELLAGLPANQVAALQPRLATLLGGVATGFFRQAWDTILDEQEQIRAALLAEHRQAEAALRNSEECYRRLVELSPETVVVHSAAEILYVNPAGAELLGAARPRALIGQSILDFVHPDDLATVQQRMRQIEATGKPADLIAEKLVRLDGRVIHVEVTSAPIAYQGHAAVQSIARDVTARKRAEAELADARHRLVQSREAERLYLAQELHDGPIQALSSVVFRLQALAGALDDEAHRTQLATTQVLLERSIRQLRTICTELRPQTLVPHGLAAAIRSHAHQFQAAHPALAVQLALTPDGQTLPEHVRLTLFRIYQQLLSNVAQHAGTCHVLIRFALDAEQAVLEVQDDGHGFVVPADLSVLPRQGHLGLLGAAERAESLGGRLAIESAPGDGTRATVRVPVYSDRWSVSSKQ